MNIPIAMQIKCPGTQWNLNGDTYEGLTMLDNTPKPTEQELIDAYASYVPIKSWSSLEFLLKFTTDERTAIAAAAVSDHVISDFRLLCAAAGIVSTDNPLLSHGMDYLVSVGLLTIDRKNEILK